MLYSVFLLTNTCSFSGNRKKTGTSSQHSQEQYPGRRELSYFPSGFSFSGNQPETTLLYYNIILFSIFQLYFPFSFYFFPFFHKKKKKTCRDLHSPDIRKNREDPQKKVCTRCRMQTIRKILIFQTLQRSRNPPAAMDHHAGRISGNRNHRSFSKQPPE